MGISPAEALDMSLYDYQAAVHGYNRGQGGDGDEGPALTGEEFDEMLVGLESVH